MHLYAVHEYLQSLNYLETYLLCCDSVIMSSKITAFFVPNKKAKFDNVVNETPLVPPPTKTSDDADGERRPLCEDQGAGGLPFSSASMSSNSSTCDSGAEAVLKPICWCAETLPI